MRYTPTGDAFAAGVGGGGWLHPNIETTQARLVIAAARNERESGFIGAAARSVDSVPNIV
jgi:hypothetical protein